MELSSISEQTTNAPASPDAAETTPVVNNCCRSLQTLRNTLIGRPPLLHESRFLKHCRVLMCMQEPVAGLLFCTVAYVWVTKMNKYGSDPFVRNLPMYLHRSHPNHTITTGEIAVASLVNSLFLLSTVIAVTLLFLVLFTYKCRKVCFAILMSAFFATTFAAPMYLTWQACRQYSIVLDWVTVLFFSWNFAAVGTLLVHWEWLTTTFDEYHDQTWIPNVSDTPLNAHNWIVHIYLVLNAVGLTWPFSCFDEWTVWSFLILLVLWDLFAVLTPCGPLRFIMNLERKRRMNGIDQFILPPGLIYETRLFQLGTGDLLFYGVVVGRAAALNYVTTACTALAVFTGMSATIWITVRSNMHALPALPLAIVLALFSLFASQYLYQPYLDELFKAGVFHV